MLLKEILADVDLIVPNSINDTTKVRWLNQVQRQMYRDYAFPDTSHQFHTEIGRSLYLLPDNCERDRITSLIIGNKAYEFKGIDQVATNGCYSIVDGKLWIHPTPSQSIESYINYRPRPRDVRVDMQNASPDFPEDFHELLVLGVAARVSRATQNHQLTRELEEDFALLELEAKKKLRKTRKQNVIINRRWG